MIKRQLIFSSVIFVAIYLIYRFGQIKYVGLELIFPFIFLIIHLFFAMILQMIRSIVKIYNMDIVKWNFHIQEIGYYILLSYLSNHFMGYESFKYDKILFVLLFLISFFYFRIVFFSNKICKYYKINCNQQTGSSNSGLSGKF